MERCIYTHAFVRHGSMICVMMCSLFISRVGYMKGPTSLIGKTEMSSSSELGSSSIKFSINVVKVKCEYIGEYSYLASQPMSTSKTTTDLLIIHTFCFAFFKCEAIHIWRSQVPRVWFTIWVSSTWNVDAFRLLISWSSFNLVYMCGCDHNIWILFLSLS